MSLTLSHTHTILPVISRDTTIHIEQHVGCRVTHLEFPTAAALPETPGTHCSSLADEKRNKEMNASAQREGEKIHKK